MNGAGASEAPSQTKEWAQIMAANKYSCREFFLAIGHLPSNVADLLFLNFNFMSVPLLNVELCEYIFKNSLDLLTM